MRSAFVLLLMFSLSGCQKIMDYYSRGSTDVITSCRIAQYTYDYYESTINTTFTYDVKGNPTKITYFDEWLPDGQAKEVFVYDQLNRLTAHIPDEYIGNRRTYIYEGDSPEPVRDTAEDAYGNKYVEKFDFDYSGRIVREEIQWVIAGEGFEDDPTLFWKEVKRYYYDVHGNRQVNPFDHPWHKTLQYNDKPSLYSLHPTWQLVFRDYSKNNASKVKSYNDKGLPVTFFISDFDYWQPFFDLAQNATVTYECK
jgi:hypothetical protein